MTAVNCGAQDPERVKAWGGRRIAVPLVLAAIGQAASPAGPTSGIHQLDRVEHPVRWLDLLRLLRRSRGRARLVHRCSPGATDGDPPAAQCKLGAAPAPRPPAPALALVR